VHRGVGLGNGQSEASVPTTLRPASCQGVLGVGSVILVPIAGQYHRERSCRNWWNEIVS